MTERARLTKIGWDDDLAIETSDAPLADPSENQVLVAFEQETVPSPSLRLGIKLKPGSGCLDRPIPLRSTADHATPPFRRQPSVRMLPPHRIWAAVIALC